MRHERGRFEINIGRQFAIIPTLGITWGNRWWKWCLCFMWLNIQARVGFGDKWRY